MASLLIAEALSTSCVALLFRYFLVLVYPDIDIGSYQIYLCFHHASIFT